MSLVLWDKKIGETLAETLKRFKEDFPKYEKEKITYAGRLDPMAEGLLILLTGKDVHKKSDFLSLDKVYEVDFFFGVATDTYDTLGVINDVDDAREESLFEDNLKKILKKGKAKFMQTYPVYASKTIKGKPLFQYARENKIHEINIPKKEVEIYSLEYLGKRREEVSSFEKKLKENIGKVKGDFRQKKILGKWEKYFFKKEYKEQVIIYSIKVRASSGTYMRSLVHRIGEKIGKPACTLKIKRLSVGNFYLEKDVLL